MCIAERILVRSAGIKRISNNDFIVVVKRRDNMDEILSLFMPIENDCKRCIIINTSFITYLFFAIID